jgi:hypothetical protein
VTLGRLVLAWIVVLAWFIVATIATAIVVVRYLAPPPDADPATTRNRALTWRAIEAGLLTLIASLWFDSLGSGGWWLLFLLIGALVAFPPWFRARPAGVAPRLLLANSVADLARYVIAGALLAWRLS